jgi:hypothetical protein
MLNIFNTNEKPNENKNRENENEKENGNENEKTDLLIQLQLGDIIELYDPKNEKLNGQTFYIDYIDKNKMFLINESTLETVKLKIDESGIIGDGTITKLIIKSRSSEKGYARQNNLLPGTCINIYFGGDLPVIITGEITNLENDMIEISMVDDDVIYINFDYKGIPEDLPIEMIEIREKPCTGINKPELEVREERKQTESEEFPELMNENNARVENIQMQLEIPLGDVKTQMREFVLKADQIQFGNETLGPIVQFVDVYGKTERYSIESQTNDLLDELLSTIPNAERTNRVLNNIHNIIERFVQLREQFSTFDEYGNVSGSVVYKPDYKPLIEFFNNFNKKLLWILPVVKNIKKTYVDNSLLAEDEFSDVINVDLNDDLDNMKNLLENYKTNTLPNEQNKYSSLYKELNPYFTPFDYINDEKLSEIMNEKMTNADLNVIIDNLGDFYSSVFRNNLLNTQRFVIQKYNLGLTRLEATNFKGSRFEAVRVNLTQPDELYLKSFLTLPEPFIRFSQINLPGTNILNRANLNSIFVDYWKLLKKNTNVEVVNVNNLHDSIDYNENNFVNNIKNYVNNLSEDDKKGFTKSEIYSQFIDIIIPKTRILFNLMKKYITGKYTIIDVVSYLEPFLIYTDNLTYQQYKDIIGFINEKISEYNKNFIERSKMFYSLKNLNMSAKLLPFSAFPVVNIVSDKNNKRRELFDDYDIDIDNNTNQYTNNEILRKVILQDNSQLYTATIILQNLHLRYPDQFSSIFEDEKLEVEKNIKSETGESLNSCKKKIIAKLYFNREELLNDNDKQIYFDKKYDDTNYGVLDDYEKDMFTKTPEEFIMFLINKLKNGLKLNDEDADYLADTLINGYKKVINGQYAILKKITNNNVEFEYYVRKNNKWELTADFDAVSASKEDGVTDSNLLCNLQEKCVSVSEKNNYDNSDKCESIVLSKSELQHNALKDILNEFDKQYNESKEEFEGKMNKRYNYLFENIIILTKIKIYNYLKYNNQKYKLGYQLDNGDGMEQLNAIVISPFAKYRDLILGQNDFIKKQQDIIKFVNICTRSFIEDGLGPLGIKETPHWLYCVETNTELFPTFKYNLASAYLNDNSNYNNVMDAIIKNIGTLSDDGDKWVDKYSGYTITYIDSDVEEGYEAGFKITSRSVLEEDAGNKITSQQKQQTLKENNVLKLDNPESIMISNVVTTLSVAMGLNIEYQKDFIINCVKEVLKTTMPKEEDYKKKIKELSNKPSSTSKAPMSYEDLYYTSILYYTLGMFLIAVQTSIPSIKTRKTFPGCVRSFTGFPFDGVGDMSSVRYLTCICYQIRKNIARPWYVLKNTKEEFIEKKIILAINENLLKLPDVKRKMDEKNEYLLTNPDEEIPKEYDVIKWTQFMPPLIPFKIKNLVNISSEFKKSLLDYLKTGNRKQDEQILVVHSKIIQFSLAIQERIQEIVKRKDLILSKMNNEYYLENACCEEKNGEKTTTIGYFEKEDSRISEYNSIVTNLSNIITDIIGYSTAVLLYSPINTKNIYPPIKKEFSEKTIYNAFIYYCNFTSLLPIPENIIPLCNQKPLDIINLSDSREEIIKKLKESGINYSMDSFLRMIQIISRNNIIYVDIDNTLISSLRKLLYLLEEFKAENEQTVPPPLVKLLFNVMDTFDIGTMTNVTSKEVKNLNDYLIKENETMKAEMVDFLRKNKGKDITRSNMNEITNFINTLSVWSTDQNKSIRNKHYITNNSIYNLTYFFKSFIENFVGILPNIILNKVDYKENYIPKYLGLSKIHEKKVKTIISDYYDKLRGFYNTPALNNILQTIPRSCDNLLKLSKNTPTFITIKNKVNGKDEEIKPIFDERTSKFLYEYYLLKVLSEYIHLTDEPAMIVKKVQRQNIVGNRVDLEDIVTVDYLDETNTAIDVNVDIDDRIEFDTNLLSGDKKELKQKVANLLIEFLRIMNSYKEIVDVSYDQVLDRIFKLKEKEKDIITDRLKKLTDEERDADTILKVNKLGVWSKGLQKGLTTYVKETYDEEREFVEQMLQYERKAQKKIRETNMDNTNLDIVLDELIEETERENEIEREAYDIGGYTEDYLDGQFEGDDVDYDDYYES